MSATKPKHVPTMTALAAALGISRETLYKVAKRDGAPAKESAGFPVEKWKDFAAGSVEKLNPDGKTEAATTDIRVMTLTELKQEKHRVEIERLRLRRDRERGELADVAFVSGYVAECLQRHMGALYRALTKEAPAKLAGRGAREIEAGIRPALDTYFQNTQEELRNAVDECQRQSLSGGPAIA